MMAAYQERLDVLFVVPRNPSTFDIVSGAYTVTAPLGVAYVAGYLREKKYRVAIIDDNIERATKEGFKEYLKKCKPRFVGFSVLTPSVDNAVAFAEIVKDTVRDTKIFAGGAHASALPEDLLKHPCFDVVVKGEGEVTALELIESLDAGESLENVRGIVYRKEARCIENADRPFIADLDALPMPAYDLLPMEKYFVSSTRKLAAGRAGSIITSRGCSYQCSFCSQSVFRREVRYRSPGSVLKEIRYLSDIYGISEFVIWDDTFTTNERHAVEISKGVKAIKRDLVWSCYSRVEQASDRMYQALYDGGCRELSFGAESGSQMILDSICKNVKVEDIEKAVQCCKRNGLKSFCCFVFGFPGETAETIQKTIQFAITIDPDFVSFCIFTPLPGSKLFSDAVQRGLINLDHVEWSRFMCLMSTCPPPVNMSGISSADLILSQKKAFMKFYFRPKYIFLRLFQLKTKDSIYQLWRGCRTILKYLNYRVTTQDE